MKTKKTLLLIIIFLSIICAKNVKAEFTGCGIFDNHVEVGIGYSKAGANLKDINKEENRNYTKGYSSTLWNIYYHSNLTFRMDNGRNLEALCLDPGLTLSSACTPMTCYFENDPALDYIVTSGQNYYIRSLAARIWSNESHRMYKLSNPTDLKDALESYGKAAFYHKCDGCNMFLQSYQKSGTDGANILAKATKLAQEAYARIDDAEVEPRDPPAEMSYERIAYQKGAKTVKATYKLTATNFINKSNISYRCENCTVKLFSWSNKGGTITINYKVEDEEKFKLTISYPNSGVYVCQNTSSSGAGTQKLAVYLSGRYDLIITETPPPSKTCGPDDPCYEYPNCKCPVCEDFKAEIKGSVHNCCEDESKISWAKEKELDALFCVNADLGVLYDLRPNLKTSNDYLIDFSTLDIPDSKKLNSEVCKMYCTERVTIEIPGTISALTGRFFKLTQTSKGTTSPYIEGYNRCRIVVDYQNWQKLYGNQIDTQIAKYNDFQQYKAREILYKIGGNVTKTSHTKSVSITCSGSKKYEKLKDGCTPSTTDNCKEEATASASESENVTYSWNKYEFDKTSITYYKVKINQRLRDNFNSFSIISNGTGSWSEDKIVVYNVTHGTPSISGKTVTSEGQTITLSCSYPSNKTVTGYDEVNVERIYSSAKRDADNAHSAYKTAVNEATKLEEQLKACNKYFDNNYSDSATIEKIYNFNPNLNFKYSQVYYDEKGDLKYGESEVEFEDVECNYTVDHKDSALNGGDGNEDKLAGIVIAAKIDKPLAIKMRSGKLEEGIYKEEINTFKSMDLSYKDSADGYKTFLAKAVTGNVPYADKIVYHDGRYKVTCSWKEKPNTVASLVQEGNATKTDRSYFTQYTEKNGVLHEQTYPVWITTYAGDFLTYWSVNPIGRRGQFDDFIKKDPATGAERFNCAQNKLTDENFSCLFSNTVDGGDYGYCNNDGSVVIGVHRPVDIKIISTEIERLKEFCKPNDNHAMYTFKVVDPANIFPSGTKTSTNKEYAYNWVKTNEGRKAKEEIEKLGSTSSTYSPNTLTYSFELTPSDMKAIKKYNTQQRTQGGYTDFNLKCKCPYQGDKDGTGATTEITSSGCVECKSTFLTNMAKENKIVYKDGTTYHLKGGWNNPNKTIDKIRETW